MKKSTKLIALIMIFALVAAIFAVAAFAEGVESTPTAESNVGLDETYPDTAWNPLSDENVGSYTGITFATWDSEGDFLDGKTPKAWYTDASFTATNIGGVGYVHCFSDVTNTQTSGRLQLPANTNIIINLGGHTLTDNSGWTINTFGTFPYSLYMVKNGTVLYNHLMYARLDTSIVYKNVIFDATASSSATLCSGSGCELFVFEDSVVRLKPNQQFELQGNNKAPIRQHFLFINTELIQTADPADTGSEMKPLFNLVEDTYGTLNWTIVFDKDCSVTRSSNNWVRLTEKAKSITYTQGIYFEMGCKISPNAMPSYDMPYTLTPQAGEAVTHNANSSGKYLEMAVLEPVNGGVNYTVPTKDSLPSVSGFNAPIDKTSGAYDGGAFTDKVKQGLYYSKTSWKLEDIEGSELKTIAVREAWKPEGNITYAVWETEAEFLDGYEPMFSTDKKDLLTEDIATIGDGITYKAEYEGKIPGYVVLYANVENKTSAICIGNTQNLVINLNGSTITNTSGFILGGPDSSPKTSALKIIDGTLNQATGAITTKEGTELTFASVTVNVSKTGKQAALAASEGNVTFTDSTINLESADAGFDLAGGNLKFESTSITQSGTPKSPLFWVEKENADISVLFDEKSSIVRNSNLYVGIALSVESTVSLKLYFENGTSLSNSAVPDFTYFTSPAPNIAGATVHTSDEGSVCDIAVVSPDLSSKSTDIYFILGEGTMKLVNSIDNYCAGELVDPTNDRLFYQLWEGALDTLNASTPFTTRDGAVIKLFKDTEVKFGGTHNDCDLTIDLNGKTLWSNTASSIQLGIGKHSTWMPNREIKFISSATEKGTLSFRHSWASPLQPRPGTNVYFENLNIEFTASLFNDDGAQIIQFKDCIISAYDSDAAQEWIVSRDAMAACVADKARYMVFDSTVTEDIGFSAAYCTVDDSAGYTVVIKNGCSIDNSVPLLFIKDDRRVVNAGAALDIDKYEKFPPSMVVRPVYIDIDTKFTCANTEFAVLGQQYAVQYHTFDIRYFKNIDDYMNVGSAIPTANLIFVGNDEYYNVCEEKDVPFDNLSYTYVAPGSVKVAVVKTLDSDDNPYLTLDAISDLPDGTVITLCCDLLFKQTVNGDYNDGYVFELDGHTLTFTESFTVRGALTFKNGAIEAPRAWGTLFVFADGVAAELLLDGITLTVGDNVTALFALNGGNLTVTDSAITAENAPFAHLSLESSLSLEGVELNAASFITVNYAVGTKLNVALTDSELDISGALASAFAYPDIYDGSSNDFVNVSISDSYVITSELMDSESDGATAPLVHFTLSETFFSCEPVADAGMADVTLAKGERAIPITGLDGYTWHVTLFDVKLKASIFIESDFGIKFYIPENTNITAITIDGVPYTVADITDTELYDGKSYKFILLTSILPTDAAEVIDITVVFNKHGASHTEETGYSVLDYFKALLNGDMTLKLKHLGVATVDYILAAYSYANKTNDELDALIASEQYALYKSETFVAESISDTSELAGVIESAQFELGNAVKFRFNLASGYTGTLTVNGREFEIENGTYNGASYISISLPAFEICRELTVSCDGAVCNYSVEAYATAIKNSTDPNVTPEMKALVAAFYNYCRYAEAFRAIYEN